MPHDGAADWEIVSTHNLTPGMDLTEVVAASTDCGRFPHPGERPSTAQWGVAEGVGRAVLVVADDPSAALEEVGLDVRSIEDRAVASPGYGLALSVPGTLFERRGHRGVLVPNRRYHFLVPMKPSDKGAVMMLADASPGVGRFTAPAANRLE
ncbi:hypothetical protein [Halobaculum rubrum]|uniref:hypothetical protein n=1 Tax=Halobaculum rubrum TaxID=2872158 RepID=UPI001CA4685F|nr:hypothetical protein [Halobaculum rubrum]QZY01162.1 hypothetical protein K6T25_15345 [Halobaculum rubrum]